MTNDFIIIVMNAARLMLRIYAVGFAVVLWSSLHSLDKDVIRWSLLASAIYFGLHMSGELLLRGHP